MKSAGIEWNSEFGWMKYLDTNGCNLTAELRIFSSMSRKSLYWGNLFIVLVMHLLPIYIVLPRDISIQVATNPQL